MTIAPENVIRPGKRGREMRCQALIDAANAVFAEHGFDAATTREIAHRAGCAEGLIHRYFNGKRGLLLAILESKASHLADDFETALPDRDSIEEEVQQLLLWFLDDMWERRDFMRVSVSRAAIDPEIGRTISAGISARRVALITGKLLRHQQAGRVRPEIDIESVAHSLAGLGFAEGFMFQVGFGEDRRIARRIMLAAADVVSRGMLPDGQATKEDT